VPGDLLTAVDGGAVTSIAELESALESAAGDRLLLELRRDDERLLSTARRDGSRALRGGGELPKAWLGIETQVMTAPIAAAVGTPELRGFRITHVLPWSAAEQADLRIGDIVVAIDGEPLEAEREQDVDNLRRAVEERAIGDRADLGVVRDGRRIELPVTFEARPRVASEARTTRHERLGFAARELTLFDRVEFHWSRDQQGVLVTEVVPGGWAQMAGLQANDLVMAVDGRETPTTRELDAELEARVARRPEIVMLFLRRGVRTHFVFLEPEWNGASTSDGERR
jgi:serine protease Do